MSEITAIVITKNEETTIYNCLKSLSFADNITVIDSGSTDKTRQIAKNLKATVINHPFINFSETRNFAVSKTNTEWVLFIDADEQVSSKLKDQIINVIESKDIAAYRLCRVNYYFGRKWPYKEKILRLFLKDHFVSWFGDLHESAKVQGEVGDLSGELFHYTHRNLEDMINKTIEWSQFEAQLRLKSNHPPVTWWRLIRVFITGFLNSFINQKGFKAGTVGLIESIYQGFSMFITYVRLWEMQKIQKQQ